MNTRRLLGLLLATLVVVIGAVTLTNQRDARQESAAIALYPTLAKDLNGATNITITKGGTQPAVSLRGQADHWTVAQRDDYPADLGKLRKLLVALSDAKISEQKTSNPASYQAIGVDDPASIGAIGAEIKVTTLGASYSLIVGKPMGDGNFVRRSGEVISYLVTPAISIDADPRSWIDPKLLEFVSSGGDSKNPSLLNAEDVAPLDTVDFNKPLNASVNLPDGTAVSLTGAAVGDKRWIQIDAAKNPTLAEKTRRRAFAIATYQYDSLFHPPAEKPLAAKPPLDKTAAKKPK
jgi:hypothetical protein